jgi:hypothetical protein
MQLSPAHVEGIGVVAETLANYSALRVVAETYGHEQMRRVPGMWRDQYEVPRTRPAVPGNSGDRLLNSTIPRVQSDE